MSPFCPSCGAPITEADIFCAHCGKNLKQKPPSTSTGMQILVYLLSLLLPPLGLWPAFKYLKQSDEKSRRIGIIAIVLTVIGTIGTIWLSIGIINTLNQTLGSLSGLSSF